MCQPWVTSTMRVTPAARSSATLRSAFSRVSRDAGLGPFQRPGEVACRDLRRHLGLGRAGDLRVAGAAAEGHRQAGLARQPQAVAQPLHRLGRQVRPRRTRAHSFRARRRARRSRWWPAPRRGAALATAAGPAGSARAAGAAAGAAASSPTAVVLLSQMPAAPASSSSQPQTGRRRASAAPSSISSSSGTGGSSSAVSTGFQPAAPNCSSRSFSTSSSPVEGRATRPDCYDCAGPLQGCGGGRRVRVAKGVMC